MNDFPQNAQGEYKVEGLVLRTIDYRDKDGIIHLATPHKIYSFLARGVAKETSKNRRLSLPFSKVILNYDPKYSRDLLFLINGSEEALYWKCTESLQIQAVQAVLTALLERHGMDPFLYEHLESFWKEGQSGVSNASMREACLLLADILKQSGLLPNVSECTVCGKKQNITAFSMENGGFVCRDDLDESCRILPKKSLLQLRRLVQAVSHPEFPMEKLDDFSWDLAFFLMLCDWYVYASDAPMRSLDFLKTLS